MLVVRYIGMEFDVTRLYALVSLALASNVACAYWLKRKPEVHEWMLAAIMAFDFLELTALLHASGGRAIPSPCCSWCTSRWPPWCSEATYAWSLAAMAMGCFFALFVAARWGARHVVTTTWAMRQRDDAAPAGHVGRSFAIAAAVIAYFVTRVTRDLEVQRNEAALARTGPAQ